MFLDKELGKCIFEQHYLDTDDRGSIFVTCETKLSTAILDQTL